MAGRPCAGEGRDLTDDLPIDPYPGLICTEFFNTHACSQQLNERRHPSEHGKRTGPPLVVYADPLATMSPVRDNPSLSGAEQTAPCKVQETVPELLFSAPASTWFEKQSYDFPRKSGPCRVSSTYDLLRSSSFEYLVPLAVISSANPLSVI